MNQVVDHTKVDEEQWYKFIEKNENSTVFHDPIILQLYKDEIGYEPFALFSIDEKGEINAMLLGYVNTVKRGLLSSISRRSIILQSPLYNTEDDLSHLLEGYLRHFCRKTIYTEIRNHVVNDSLIELYEKYNFKYHPHLNYIIDCSNYDKTWKSISKDKRWEIRKGLENGAEIVNYPNEEEIRQFYELLEDFYYNELRKPLPSFSFFLKSHKISSSQPSVAKFILIRYQDKIISGSLWFFTNSKYIHGYYGATNKTFRKLYPGTLNEWAGIEYAMNNNIELFDFMGAGKPEEEYGVRSFKKKFGGTLIEPGRYNCIHHPLKMKLAEIGFKLIQKIQVSK